MRTTNALLLEESMPEVKHSPGPWIIDEVNTPNGVGYFINHLWEDGSDDDGPVTRTDEIAEVVMDYADPAIPLANAKILAAAPELLAACRQMHEAIKAFRRRYGAGMLSGAIVEAESRIIEAIDKAQGEP